MIILCDTREQAPLIFNHKFIEGVERVKLEVGDYSVRFKDGYTPPIIFERKGIADLYSTMTSGYKRFKKEIIRSQEAKVQLFLIIEGNMSKVLKGTQYSTVDGITIVIKLFTLWLRYNIQPIFTRDREEMAQFIAEFYSAIGRERLREVK